MFHVPAGALVVPSSFLDMQNVINCSGFVPVPAAKLPMISARAKLAQTTVVFGTNDEIAAAIKSWGSNPVVSVGAQRDDASVSFPSDFPLAFLERMSAPSPVKAMVVGDVHNCHRTLRSLLCSLNITEGAPTWKDPLLVFVGDLVDKGGSQDSDVIETIRLVKHLTECGQAVVVRGNHEQMLSRRFMELHPATASSQRSLDALAAVEDGADLAKWLGSRPLVFELPRVDDKRVVVAHANMTASAFEHGARAQRLAEQACLFGRRTGAPFSGVLVHGHWEVSEVEVHADSTMVRVNVDTGACLGNKLSAFDASVPVCSSSPSVVCVDTVQDDLNRC
jgi:hypothetical protein